MMRDAMKENTNGSVILTTPEAISAFRLLAIRSGMKLLLACPGMTMRVNPFKVAAGILRTKTRNRKKLYEEFCAHLVLIGVCVPTKAETN